MSGPRPTAVIFDLDGTLVQTRISSWEIFRKVSDEFGLGIDDPEEYFALFNGNLYSSLKAICRSDEQADQVKAALLRRLCAEYTPEMVPGMASVVRTLASTCTLAVMSSNSVEVVRRILAGNQLAFCFAHVFGGDIGESKRDAIAALVADPSYGFGRRCEGSYDEAGSHTAPALATTVLVTDTAGDVREAAEAGIRAVGVAWGMHSVADLETAGAEFVALWPQEITARLLEDGAPVAATGACALPPAPVDLRGEFGRATELRRGRRQRASSALLERHRAVPADARRRAASAELISAVTDICP